MIKMTEIKELGPSEELAYWIGAAQSDGCLSRSLTKGRAQYKLEFGVCSKSLPMLERFRDVSRIFKTKARIWKDERRPDVWRYCIGVKELIPLFRELGIILSPVFIPPFWSMGKEQFFGAYLAGVIDGDGDVRIKRKQYPQCLIRISTGIWQDILQKQIETTLKVQVRQSKRHINKFSKSFGKIIQGSWIEVEFGVTRKSHQFILDYVVPHIQLAYKKEKLSTFISKKYAPVGI